MPKIREICVNVNLFNKHSVIVNKLHPIICLDTVQVIYSMQKWSLFKELPTTAGLKPAHRCNSQISSASPLTVDLRDHVKLCSDNYLKSSCLPTQIAHVCSIHFPANLAEKSCSGRHTASTLRRLPYASLIWAGNQCILKEMPKHYSTWSRRSTSRVHVLQICGLFLCVGSNPAVVENLKQLDKFPFAKDLPTELLNKYSVLAVSPCP